MATLPGKLAVLSDPHGNLEALRRVLEDMDAQGAEEAVCLGDAVGYGPEPEAVVRLLRERGIPQVMGNHEHGIADKAQMCRFNPQARQALERTACLLEPATAAFLSGLPRFIVRHGARFVHGCPPDRVNTYLYMIRDKALPALFGRFPEEICFVGHTHELALVEFDGTEARNLDLNGGKLFEPGKRYIVNVGAVGQPRDGDNRAKYVLWEPEARKITVRRVAYDIQKTVDRMRELGMPEVYADRLW
ncbi:metallophosphoesterase family protein [Desulfovibrio sp.]